MEHALPPPLLSPVDRFRLPNLHQSRCHFIITGASRMHLQINHEQTDAYGGLLWLSDWWRHENQGKMRLGNIEDSQSQTHRPGLWQHTLFFQREKAAFQSLATNQTVTQRIVHGLLSCLKEPISTVGLCVTQRDRSALRPNSVYNDMVMVSMSKDRCHRWSELSKPQWQRCLAKASQVGMRRPGRDHQAPQLVFSSIGDLTDMGRLQSLPLDHIWLWSSPASHCLANITFWSTKRWLRLVICHRTTHYLRIWNHAKLASLVGQL